MSITREKKSELISSYGITNGDTGSVEVQCAILTERIKNITDHLKSNIHDFSSRRGLLILVARRRSLLKYLKTREFTRYENLIQKLGIRK